MGISLVLVVVIDLILLNQLQGKQSFLQIKIESLLPQREEKQEVEFGDVRVLIKTNGFLQVAHSEVKVSADTEIDIISGEEISTYPANEVITIIPSDERFANGNIKITLVENQNANHSNKISIPSLKRGYGIPSYRGDIELFKTAEGIVIINELPMEQYLYAVVPSEMPASYEQEALKVQAVCARSYAYNQTREYSYPEYKAHVDDSTMFQVYGNSKEQDSTIRAVDETAGQLLWYNGHVATAYYYSTSCGKTTSIRAWGTEFHENNRYLQSVELSDENGNAYEANLPWYRWTVSISSETLCNLLELNTGIELGKLQSLQVTKEGDGGIVQQITAKGDCGVIVVETENKIRRALGGDGYKIEKQDGTVVDSTELLPSAFFTITQSEESYIIKGGGYGHGIGMSQNGANEMAKAGMNYREILETFYTDIEIR